MPVSYLLDRIWTFTNYVLETYTEKEVHSTPE